MKKFVSFWIFYLATVTISQGQLQLHDANLIFHAIVVEWDAESGRYREKETLVRNAEEKKEVDQLIKIDGLGDVFKNKNLLIVKFRVKGNPRTWVPIENERVEIIDLEGKKRKISLADLKALWQVARSKEKPSKMRE